MTACVSGAISYVDAFSNSPTLTLGDVMVLEPEPDDEAAIWKKPSLIMLGEHPPELDDMRTAEARDQLREDLWDDLHVVLTAEHQHMSKVFDLFNARQEQQIQAQQSFLERSLVTQRAHLCGALEDSLRRSLSLDEKPTPVSAYTSEQETGTESLPLHKQKTTLELPMANHAADASKRVSSSRERRRMSDSIALEDVLHDGLRRSQPRLSQGSSIGSGKGRYEKKLAERGERKQLSTAQRWNDIEATFLKSKGSGSPTGTTTSQFCLADTGPKTSKDDLPVKPSPAGHVMLHQTWTNMCAVYIDQHFSLISSLLGRLTHQAQWARFALGKQRCNCTLIRAMTDSRFFAATVFLLITSNACFIAVSTDYTIQVAFESYFSKDPNGTVESPDWIKIGDVIFIFAFIIELVCRVLALEGDFFVGPAWPWNVFDAVLTTSSCLELALIAVNLDLSYIRVLRLARIARSFRVFHLLKWASLIRSLRLMLFAIVKSVVPFMWAVLVLFMIIFVFAVVLLNGVTNYVNDAGDGNFRVDEMQVAFGSMSLMVVTLFMSVSGGRDWWEIWDLFHELPAIYPTLFLFFILVLVLAVLNIITGIFVKEAMDMAHLDRDLQMQLELEENRYFLRKLKVLFERIDADGGGTMSLEEFEAHMESEELRVLFSLIGLDVADAVSFFKVLDVDGSNELQIEDFVTGCMRHKGNSTMDLECSVMDIKKMVKKHTWAFSDLSGQLQHVASDVYLLRSFFEVGLDSQHIK
mmetsp:Transcript_29910/g.79638  ORF Transcript_29910/g.79638 Transcript_29910/m.79638 type:complete len:751 (-) Transcript_29910:255-2507(-)